MHTVELIGDDKKERKYTLPSSWKECSVAQLGSIAVLTSIALATDATDEDRMHAEAHIRMRLFHELTGMSDMEFAQLEPADLITLKYDELGAERAALLPWVDWCMVEPNFHESLVSEVSVKKKRFIGPQNMLTEWTLNQWLFADALLTKLAATGADEDLNNLMGALYRPFDRKWNNKHLEDYAAVLSGLDPRVKLAAVLNYRGLRAWFAAKYRRAFRGGEQDPHGPKGMIVRLAGIKFGSTKKVPGADLHDVMVYVEQCIQEKEEVERNRPK